MNGNNIGRVCRLVGHLLSHPIDGVSYVNDRLKAKQSPLERRLPWMSWTAIRRLEHLMSTRDQWKVFEWGGGGSTRFFLDHGCQVTTVEDHLGWAEQVRAATADAADRLDLRVVSISSAGGRDAYVDAVRHGGPWDIIVVDGVADTRMHCMVAARECLATGGIIVLDDAWRSEYNDAPTILSGFPRVIERGNGPCRPGVTQTDFYRTPA